MNTWPGLQTRTTAGSVVEGSLAEGFRLQIPPGPAGAYRWAQLDDYMQISRRHFLWQAPVKIELTMRASHPVIPGTWGFGLWNDPFSVNFGLGGMGRRLPALPNTAWFFFASPPNYLALCDHHPAQGLLAAVFSSPPAPGWMLLPAGLALPFLFWPPAGRQLRWVARKWVKEDAIRLDEDVTLFHSYGLEWSPASVRFSVDGQLCLETRTSPRGRLGLVIWIDNQYFSFLPTGRLQAGTLAFDQTAWLEIRNLRIG